MTVSYQVGGGGHLDIDFWVSISLRKRGYFLTALGTISFLTLTAKSLENTSGKTQDLCQSQQQSMADMNIASLM
jgi:hypothetical protein